MDKQKTKNKWEWTKYLGVVFFLFIGFLCGICIGKLIYLPDAETLPLGQYLLQMAFMIIWMYLAILLHMIIHEAGHLVFGLLTGYKFSSFRIFSIMWLKEDDKIVCKRLSLAGTGGQCLLLPPDMKDGKIPYVLYNLGGSLANISASILFLGLYYVCGNHTVLSTMMMICVIVGVVLAMMNGIPMRMGTVDNDGYNAFSIGKNPDAMRAFWLQMKINELQSKGIRLKDMEDAWFICPTDDAMQNSMVAAVAVFSCNRLVDAHRFAEADMQMVHLLSLDKSGIIGLHRNLMLCDRMYIELITENRREIIDSIRTKELQKFMKSMKNFISILRTEYAYALLCEKDTEKAAHLKEQFEKTAKTYPYQSDIQSEWELITIAEQAAAVLPSAPLTMTM